MFSYFIFLNKFLKKHLAEIEKYNSKKYNTLDNEFLEHKSMKTKEFLQYHKKIHELEEDIESYGDNIIYCRWSAIILIILLIADATLDLIRKWISNYTFQNIVWLGIFLSAIFFTVYLVNIFSVRKNDLR